MPFRILPGDNTPASLSPVLLKDILRKDLDYKGLIITDDLVMQGALGSSTLPEVCEMAIRAGSDFLLISRNPQEHEKIREYLTLLIAEDPEFLEMIRQSARRVLLTKIRYLKGEGAVPLIPEKKQENRNIPAIGSEDFFFSQAVRSTTLIKKENNPVKAEDSPAHLPASFQLSGMPAVSFFPARKP